MGDNKLFLKVDFKLKAVFLHWRDRVGIVKNLAPEEFGTKLVRAVEKINKLFADSYDYISLNYGFFTLKRKLFYMFQVISIEFLANRIN